MTFWGAPKFDPNDFDNTYGFKYTFDVSAFTASILTKMQQMEDNAAIEIMINLLEEKGYLVIPDSAFPAVGIDAEYVTEVATLMTQLGISKGDIAAHLQTVARFRNLVPQLDMSDAQWEAMVRWFREFMRTFGGFNNGTEGQGRRRAVLH